MSDINFPDDLAAGKTRGAHSGREYQQETRPRYLIEREAQAQLDVIRMPSAELNRRVISILYAAGPAGIPLQSIYAKLGRAGARDSRKRRNKALYRVRNTLQRLANKQLAESNGRGVWWEIRR